MSDCYKGDCLLRVNYTSNIYGCENVACEQRIGLNTSHISEEEKEQFREAFRGKPFTFRMVPDSEQRLEQEPAERYDPMEYIWKRRKKWAVKFQCNTDGSTICFGYVCPKCMYEADEPLDECPGCGKDMCSSDKTLVSAGPGDPGPKGPPGVCPRCGGTDISWEADSDVSRCNTCGWSDGRGEHGIP